MDDDCGRNSRLLSSSCLRVKRCFKGLIVVGNIGSLIMLLLPSLPLNMSLWWLDNLVSLQLQWALIALLLIAINFCLRQPYAPFVAVLMTGLIMLNHFSLFSPKTNMVPYTETLKVAQFNMRYDNPHIDALIRQIIDADFDLILLQEVSDRQQHKIIQLSTKFPYSAGAGQLARFPSGLALYSRWPVVDKTLHTLTAFNSHVIEAIVQSPISNTPVQIFAIHPNSPRSELLWTKRNNTLTYVANQVKASPFTFKMILGDFNTANWSSQFEKMQQKAHLKNTGDSFGYIPSWSYQGANAMLRFITSAYIDHCLVTPAFSIVDKQFEFIQGSDHVLISTKLGLN